MPLGVSAAQERRALARALIDYERDAARSGARDALSTLETFVETSPPSRSRPSSAARPGVDDLVAGGVGALVGVAVQGGFDLVHGEVSSWQDYTAAAVGGAAGGVATLYGGPIAGGAAGGAAANLTRQGLNIASGKQCSFSFTSLAIETGSAAALGVVAKGVGKLASGVVQKVRGAPPIRPATAQPVGGAGVVLRDGQGATAAEIAASSGGPSGGGRVGQDAVRRELLANVPPGEPYTCWRCGQTSTNPADMLVGHRNVPTSQGGNLDRANVCLEGAACNLSSGNRGGPGPGMSCAERGSCGAPYGR